MYINRGDQTQVGHVLGNSDKRSVLPEPERGLSPSGCALLRLLLHSVLVWSSSNADDVSFLKLDFALTTFLFRIILQNLQTWYILMFLLTT